MHQSKMFNGSIVFAHSLFIEFERVLGMSPQPLMTLVIYYQNNLFLGMLQLKFCLKTFETYSLLSISVLKCSILAIILFEQKAKSQNS